MWKTKTVNNKSAITKSRGSDTRYTAKYSFSQSEQTYYMTPSLQLLHR